MRRELPVSGVLPVAVPGSSGKVVPSERLCETSPPRHSSLLQAGVEPTPSPYCLAPGIPSCVLIARDGRRGAART